MEDMERKIKHKERKSIFELSTKKYKRERERERKRINIQLETEL